MTKNNSFVHENESVVLTLPNTRGSVVSFDNIRYTVETREYWCGACRATKKKDVLRGVSGIMKPGLNAIMGPSGSGKSSLLDGLAGRKNPDWITGSVLLNGRPLPKNFRYRSGYVVQNDLMVGTITVREHLWFSANLRLSTSITHSEKKARIAKVMDELGLTSCADSKVGTELVRGISGGERKRTSIAIELILNPDILFLDEPTTGLDAATASSVMLLLKKLADKGNTIVCSIHQPRYGIFKLFDTLTLLSKGNLVYHGPSAEAIDFFTGLGYECEVHDNPADFMLDLLDGAYEADRNDNNSDAGAEPTKTNYLGLSEKLKTNYRQTVRYKAIQQELDKMNQIVHTGDADEKQDHATGFLHQLKILLRRTGKNIMRNPQALIANIGFNIILGLVVGLIFLQVDNSAVQGVQNRFGLLFFATTNMVMSSLGIVGMFQREREIFMHEYVSGYYFVISYFLSKVLADLVPLRTITPLFFCIVTYWMVGLKAEPGSFFIYLLTAVLLGYAAVGIGIFFSARLEGAIAHLATYVTFIFSILFSGLLSNVDSIVVWLSWLRYFAVSRYAYVAVSINEFRGEIFMRCNAGNSSESQVCESVRGEEFIRSTLGIGVGAELTDWDLWQNIVALIIIVAALYTLTYIQMARIKFYS